MADLTWNADKFGNLDRIKATAPVTSGAAKDVPKQVTGKEAFNISPIKYREHQHIRIS